MKIIETYHGTRNGYTYHACRCAPCKAAKKEASATYYAIPENKTKAMAGMSAYYTKPESRTKKADRDAKYNAKPEARVKKAARRANRRARKLNQWDENIDRLVVWTRDKGVCHICQLPADPNNWHLEHKIALCKGGRHSYDNVGVSHPFCNMSKGSK